MKKYKLINRKTNQETICEKVVVDGFEYYFSSEKATKINQWVIDTEYHPSCIVYKTDKQFFELGKEEFLCIATTNSNIDIPKVVNEIEMLANKYGGDEINDDIYFSFIEGYNKSQETHPFSEEDMIEFVEWLSKINYGQLEYFDGSNLKPFKELLQIWKEQKPKIVYYE